MIRPPKIVLAADQSEALRDRLVAELSDLKSADEAADWVHKNLPEKNTLTPADAEAVEASFRERLATIDGGQVNATAADAIAIPGDEPDPATRPSPRRSRGGRPSTDHRPASSHYSETIRLRDKEHCKFVAAQPCVICGRTPAEAHHIRFAQPRALNRKVSDEYTVPVCRVHHRELHRYGDEASWWAGVSIDPLPIALELWRRSRLTYSLDATWSEALVRRHPASQRRRSSGRPWTTTPGTGSTWLNIPIARPLDYLGLRGLNFAHAKSPISLLCSRSRVERPLGEFAVGEKGHGCAGLGVERATTGDQTEARTPPRYAAFPNSRPHQLSAIAQWGVRDSGRAERSGAPGAATDRRTPCAR